MKSIGLFCSTLFFLFSPISEARCNLDSLHTSVLNANSDSSAIVSLIGLGNHFKSTNSDSAIVYYDKALALCNKEEFISYKAEALLQKAVIFDLKGDSTALDLYALARNEFKVIDENVGIGRVELNLGAWYYYQGDYHKALEQYLMALEIFRKENDEKLISRTLNNLGVLYRQQKKYERAIDIYQQSIEIKESLGDEVGIVTSLMNLGSVYSFIGEEEKFRENYQKAYSKVETLDDKELLAELNTSFGQGLTLFKRNTEAKIYLEKAFSFYKDYPQKRRYEIVINLLGKAYMEAENYHEAIALFEIALERNRQTNRKIMINSHLSRLANAQHKVGLHEEAYLSMLEAYRVNDMIATERQVSITEEMQAKFDLKEKDEALKFQKLETDKQKQSKQLLILIISFISLLLFTGAYSLYQKNKHNRLLKEKNKVIQIALEDKATLVKEIHHRVKNNLQFISSLLNLQSQFVTKDNALMALEESQNRVNSMSILHLNLYQDDNITEIDMKRYLDQLIESVKLSYDDESNSVVVKKDIDSLFIDVDKAISIGLIINELLSNIFKHAFPEDSKGEIHVGLKNSNERIQISVSDDGIGMDDSVLEPDKTQSFGWRLIKLLTAKLGAKCQITSSSGTHVSLSMPQ